MPYSCFDAIYLCETVFSYLNMAKTFQYCLTDKHVESLMRLTLSHYSPDFQLLMDEVQMP